MSAKKDPSQRAIPLTISLPQWLWEKIDAQGEPGSLTTGRSAIVRLILEKSVEGDYYEVTSPDPGAKKAPSVKKKAPYRAKKS